MADLNPIDEVVYFSFQVREYLHDDVTRDVIFKRMKEFESTLDVDPSAVWTDILGADIKERVETYTMEPVGIVGGWPRLEADRRKLENELRATLKQPVVVILEKL